MLAASLQQLDPAVLICFTLGAVCLAVLAFTMVPRASATSATPG